MFVSLWHYLKGYVIVEVSGYSLDKFIHCAVKSGISFWKVKKLDDKLYLSTTIDGFKKLKPHAHKNRCRLKITKKVGLPFLQFRYRKRMLFAIGSMLFAIGICFLCSFVWLVEVEGVAHLDETDVITYLAEEGYTTGRLKSKLDLREAERVLMEHYPSIVWAGIEFEGTKLVIEVAEAVPKPETPDESRPCHIKAKKDALITYIATEQGMPQVKAGDTIQKGDIIVSGSAYLEDEFQTLYLTHAKATIKAKTCYSIVATTPLEKTNKVYTNEVATKYTLKLFNTEFPLFHGKKTYEQSDTLITIKQMKLTDNFPLPFYWQKEECAEYISSKESVTTEEAKDILLGAAHDELLSLIDDEATVLKQEIIYTEEDGMLKAVYNVVVEEEISELYYLTEEETTHNPLLNQEEINQ